MVLGQEDTTGHSRHPLREVQEAETCRGIAASAREGNLSRKQAQTVTNAVYDLISSGEETKLKADDGLLGGYGGTYSSFGIPWKQSLATRSYGRGRGASGESFMSR